MPHPPPARNLYCLLCPFRPFFVLFFDSQALPRALVVFFFWCDFSILVFPPPLAGSNPQLCVPLAYIMVTSLRFLIFSAAFTAHVRSWPPPYASYEFLLVLWFFYGWLPQSPNFPESVTLPYVDLKCVSQENDLFRPPPRLSCFKSFFLVFLYSLSDKFYDHNFYCVHYPIDDSLAGVNFFF